MASLIIGGVVLGIDKIKQSKQKKKDNKEAHNAARFSELEKENAKRISNLQKNSCFCQQSDWTGGGCPNHAQTSYRDGQIDDHQPRHSSEGMLNTAGSGADAGQAGPVKTEGWVAAPPSMNEDEIAKINEERRKKGGRYKKLFRRREA